MYILQSGNYFEMKAHFKNKFSLDPGLTHSLSQGIVSFRNKKKSFRHFDQLNYFLFHYSL